ncbi:MAG: protein-disulfide reductase DsbD [Pseudomonadota bacterium]
MNHVIKFIDISLVVIVLMCYWNTARAEQTFLPVNEAFPVSVDVVDDRVNVVFDSAQDYYLYKGRFQFHVNDAAAKRVDVPIKADFPKGIVKDDPYFGRVEVFYGQTVVSVHIDGALPQGAELVYQFQGCAEAGFCYPPKTKKAPLPASFLTNTPTTMSSSIDVSSSDNGSSVTQKKNVKEAFWSDFSSDDILATLKQRSVIGVLSFFILGVLLAFTPCVLPMVPILSGIILSNGSLSTKRSVYLSGVYVLGMALTYALLGVLVAYFGTRLNLQLYLQHPVTLIMMACLFVLLSLAMFGVFELRLPAFIQKPLSHLNQNLEGGSAVGVGVMGVLSAFIVSPCVSAPLAGVLIYIASTGDVLYGACVLFVLALGMGAPLLLIGLLGPKAMPRSGIWMDVVKRLLGMLLLAVSVWLLSRFLSHAVEFALWCVWLVGCVWILIKADNRWVLCIGVIICAVLAVLFTQRFMTTQTTSVLDSKWQMPTVQSSQELRDVIAQHAAQGHPTIVDVYADWCVACQVMEEHIFHNPAVRSQLAHIKFIKIDASDVGPETDALFREYNIIGLPNVMLFDVQGKEVRQARILGELSADAFLERVNRHNSLLNASAQ